MTQEAADTLEILIERFPEPQYWAQLGGIYSELEREKDALVTLELGYKQGYLTKSTEIKYLVQLMLTLDVPYRAAAVIADSLKKGIIKPDKHNHELWAAALIQAQELEKSLAPLTVAARLSSDGNLDLKMAQILIQRQEWEQAGQALDIAWKKGALKEPGLARILAGIAHFNQGEIETARKDYNQARAHERTRTLADQYIKYLDSVAVRQ